MLSTTVTTFIPPWNSCDGSAVRAVEDAGFPLLSAGDVGFDKVPSRLRFLPKTVDLVHLPYAIAEARQSTEPFPIVVALLHSYDLREVDTTRGTMTYEECSHILDWLQAQKDVVVKCLREIASDDDRSNDLTVDRFLKYCRWKRSPFSFATSRLLPRLSRYTYPGTEVLDRANAIRFCTAASVYGALALFPFLMAHCASNRRLARTNAVYRSVLLLVTCAVILAIAGVIAKWVLQHGIIGLRVKLLAAVLLGTLLGLSTGFCVSSRKCRQ